MKKRKKLIGLLTVLATVSLAVIGGVLLSQGILFEAFYVQFAMFNTSALVVLCGLYLLENHCQPTKWVRNTIWSLGGLVLILGALVSFDVIDAKSTWNLLIGFSVVYITAIQLQLMKWEKSKSLLKVMGLLTFVSNLFIAVYFLALLKMQYLGIIFDIAVIVSIFAFLVGLILSRQKKEKITASEA